MAMLLGISTLAGITLFYQNPIFAAEIDVQFWAGLPRMFKLIFNLRDANKSQI